MKISEVYVITKQDQQSTAIQVQLRDLTSTKTVILWDRLVSRLTQMIMISIQFLPNLGNDPTCNILTWSWSRFGYSNGIQETCLQRYDTDLMSYQFCSSLTSWNLQTKLCRNLKSMLDLTLPGLFFAALFILQIKFSALNFLLARISENLLCYVNILMFLYPHLQDSWVSTLLHSSLSDQAYCAFSWSCLLCSLVLSMTYKVKIFQESWKQIFIS